MDKKVTVTNEIKESDIRAVIWMLKVGKTKKACCEQLKINYNVKRLDSIINDFKEKESRVAALRKERSKTPFSKEEKISVVQDYNAGDSQSKIAERYFTTSARIKSILIEMNIPIRSRSKYGEAKIDHVTQNLDVIFKKNDKVFIPKINSFGIIKEIYDEEWLDYYKQPTKRSYIELPALESARKSNGEFFEGKEDVHWNIYWKYDNGEEWKEWAIKQKIKEIENIIEETGRENYMVWVEGDNAHYKYCYRDSIFPVGV
jgi:hypothetical protein